MTGFMEIAFTDDCLKCYQWDMTIESNPKGVFFPFYNENVSKLVYTHCFTSSSSTFHFMHRLNYESLWKYKNLNGWVFILDFNLLNVSLRTFDLFGETQQLLNSIKKQRLLPKSSEKLQMNGTEEKCRTLWIIGLMQLRLLITLERIRLVKPQSFQIFKHPC